MIHNTRDGDVVTSVLTIESVSLNDNRSAYFCEPVGDRESYIGVISVAGKHYTLIGCHKAARGSTDIYAQSQGHGR